MHVRFGVYIQLGNFWYRYGPLWRRPLKWGILFTILESRVDLKALLRPSSCASSARRTTTHHHPQGRIAVPKVA